MISNKSIIKIQLAIIVVFAVILLSSASWSATYYVDATNGNDSNPGTSEATPWKTISKVNKNNFQPGDFVLFKRAETWREQLTLRTSGTDGSPITCGAYGSGDDPIISGADDITTAGWTAQAGNVWRHAIGATEPKVVIFDGVVGTIDATPDAQYEWTYTNHNLDIYSTSDPDSQTYYTLIEAGQRNNSIVSNNSADYIVVDGLKLSGGNDTGIYSVENNNWTVQNCTIKNVYNKAILAAGNMSGAGSASGWIIQDNFIGEVTRIETLNSLYSGLEICGQTTPIIRRNTISTINTWGINVAPGSCYIAGATSSDAQIYENEITDCEAGIQIRYTDGIDVYRNYVHDGRGSFINVVWYSDDAMIYYNIVHDLALSESVIWNGIDVNAGSDNGFIFNNVIYGVHHSNVTLEYNDGEGVPSNGWTVQNNILDCSTNTEGSNPASCINIYHANQDTNSMTFSNNVYNSGDNSVATHKSNAGAAAEEFTLEAWRAFIGGDNSTEQDPLFISPTTSDFRLQATSPCIDTGIAVGLTQDYAGNGLSGSSWDIGAFEYERIFSPKKLRIVPFP